MLPVTITTPRLLLRPLSTGDIDEVAAACQDLEILRWIDLPSPYERQHAQHFIEHIAADGWQAGTMYHFAVRPLAGGPLLGSVNVHNHTGTWEIGYWAVREHRGHGYTTEAVTELARWAFTTLEVHRLEWRCLAGNDASRAVAERAGFRFEGHLRGATRHHDTLRDLWIGALLAADLDLPAGAETQATTAQRGEPTCL